MARRVATILALDGVQQVVAGFQQAGAAAKTFAGSVSGNVGKALDGVSKHSATISMLGRGFSIAGGLAAAGLGAVTKAAMDWETAWAGVEKTVDGTASEMDALESSLRSLATSMPATHREIAAVAEAAGQLGIAREDVASFTKTMVQLGETTNLSADTAATSLAQFMNIMGTSAASVGRLGATLVALGNDGASTEADIMALSARLAATGAQMRMSEADVMGYANAMASVGIEAEAGGTAMSMAWKDIDKAVREGGKSLNLIAKVSGVTAAEFRQSWGIDAAGATATFIDGLGRMSASGEDVNAVLSELGMTGIRQTDTLLRLAGATKAAGAETDLLRDSLKLGAKAYAENAALAEEYAKRADTTAAKAQVAWNNIRDAAISSGQQMLPIVAQLADGLADIASRFGALPTGTQAAVLGLMAVVAAGGLGVGALTKMVTTVAELRTGLIAMGVSAKTASVSMGAIGIALAGASLLLGGWIQKQSEAKAIADQYAQAMRDQGAALGELSRATAEKNLLDSGMINNAKLLGLTVKDLTGSIEGNAAAQQKVADATTATIVAWENGKASKEQLDAARALNKELPKQAAAFAAAADAAAETEAAQRELSSATDKSADASKLDARAKALQNDSIEAQKQKLDAAIQSASAYADIMLRLSGSAISLEQAIDDTTEAIARNGATLDLDTQAGRDNQRALDDLTRAGRARIDVLLESQAPYADVLAAQERATAAFVAGSIAAGMEEGAARALAAALFEIPQETQAKVSAPGVDESKRSVDNLDRALRSLPADTQTAIRSIWDSQGYDAAVSALAAENGREYRNYLYTEYRAVTIGSTMGGNTVDADGSVKEYYSRGGIRWPREHHVAQIVPADTIRVWAEPETGGEAYIPLSPAKRGRSTAILDEVASRFGYQLVRSFADGGMLRPAPAAPMVIAAPATAAGVDGAALASSIARALGSRPVQVQVLMDGREISAGIRAFNRGLV